MAELLKRMVMSNQLSEQVVLNFLVQKNLSSILQLYFVSLSENEDFLKSAPESHSVCEWSSSELLYYNLVVAEIEQQDIAKMFPEIHQTKLTEKAELFLKENEGFNDASTAPLTFKLFPKKNQFQRKCFSALAFPTEKSRVDDVMEILLKEVFDSEYFEPLTQHKIKLKVNKEFHWTTPNCLVWFLPLNVFKIICVEDKVGALTEKQVDDAEAQLIGEGIAACQNANWLVGKPIILLRFIGLRVTIYKAVFLENVLEAVRNGERGMRPSYVQKYLVKDYFKNEGFNLLDVKERSELVLIMCCIENEMKALIKK